MPHHSKLTPAEIAVLETFVVPQYLQHFGRLMLDMLLVGESARIAHLGCRTGYPDRQLLKKVTSCSIFGIDPSLAALELARNKAATLGDAALDYRVGVPEQTDLPGAVFSHALTLHPIATLEHRRALLREMERLVYIGGQVLVALPLRGSFQEVLDLVREYALKFDDADFAAAADAITAAHPTEETMSEELEGAGFDDIDVEVVPTTLSFEGGRSFVEDPSTRLLIFPELQAASGDLDWTLPLDYVKDAIDKYWSEMAFTLTVNVGCASGRKR